MEDGVSNLATGGLSVQTVEHLHRMVSYMNIKKPSFDSPDAEVPFIEVVNHRDMVIQEFQRRVKNLKGRCQLSARKYHHRADAKWVEQHEQHQHPSDQRHARAFILRRIGGKFLCAHGVWQPETNPDDKPIGHPQWDTSVSRLSLIGLRQRTRGTRGVKTGRCKHGLACAQKSRPPEPDLRGHQCPRFETVPTQHKLRPDERKTRDGMVNHG